MSSHTSRHTLTLSIWLAYLIFVVYGSLVPLDFKPLPLDRAWSIFQHIRMFNLGVESRADWIANGVLYVPLGFLTAHLLLQLSPTTPRVLLLAVAGLFSFALAAGVEFTQIFFPPRTVSLNDLLAECIGTLIGLALAVKYSAWLKVFVQALSNPRRLTLHLLEIYLVGYVAYSLFPYDVLLSAAEFSQKMREGNWGWLLAGDVHGKLLIALKLLAEIVLTLPFGLYLGYRSVRQNTSYKQAILVGLLLGGFIELAQLFTASGVSQGLSVLARAAGACGGLALWKNRQDWSAEKLAVLIRRYALPIGAIYIAALLYVNGWFSHRWNDTDFALSRLSELHFLPFYYHYFTTEAKALFSLAMVCLAYLPIGLLTWSSRGSPARGFFYALLVASVVESGKLFMEGARADPTNLLLAALASAGMVLFARTLSAASLMTSSAGVSAMENTNAQESQSASPNEGRELRALEPEKRWSAHALMLPLLAFSAYRAATFPTQPVLLSLFLAFCAAIVWYRPVLIAGLLPAALPVLDLAPWSGRFYLDEFDLLVIISIAIGYARVPPVRRDKRQTDPLFVLAGGLFALSLAIAAVRGLMPWHAPDLNSFTNYYSGFNALRIGKGALSAVLIYRLLKRMDASGMKIRHAFTWGMVTGLSLTVAWVFWERVAFSGLFNFTSDYRISGPFSAMHIGGAYVECFLAVATPFLLVLVLQTRHWLIRIAGATLILATTYALLVTFSRNGYSSFGVTLLVILFFYAFRSGRWKRSSVLAVTITGAILAVALPIFTGQFAQSRIATIGTDYLVRQAHWQDAINMRSPDFLTTVFGMGLGRYPATHYLISSEPSHAGTYQFRKEAGNTFLRLVSGNSIYIEQLVSVEPKQNYLLKLDARSNRPKSTITVPICEKWLLASYNCMWSSFDLGEVTGEWHHLEVKLASEALLVSPWYARRPIKLALYNGDPNTIIDVDNVRLEAVQGEDLLTNGDFSNTLDHWFLSTDSHLQWHAKSLPVAVLFDQGWFGLISLCAFSLLALKRGASRAWRGDLVAAAALASFSGFLVVGLFDTLIDAPRFLFLFLLLGWFCCSANIHESRHGRESSNG